MSRPCKDMKRFQTAILDRIYREINLGNISRAKKLIENNLRPFHEKMRAAGCPRDSIVDFDLEQLE